MRGGRKGGEDTFGDKYHFAEHLRELVARDLPKINVELLVYPKYETRGDLGETVSRFRTWSVCSFSPTLIPQGSSPQC